MNEHTLRSFETKLREDWEAGKIKVPLHLSGGNERQLLEIFKEVKKDDYVFSTHRNHYHYLLHGGDPMALQREIYQQDNALCKGRAGSMCTMDLRRRFIASAIVGGICGIAVGTAWALKHRGSRQHAWAFIGDGAVDTGHFWEALRYSQGWKLPVTFVIEDNDRSTCTSVAERWGSEDIDLADTEEVSNIRYYYYEPVYPHVGSGVYVQF